VWGGASPLQSPLEWVSGEGAVCNTLTFKSNNTSSIEDRREVCMQQRVFGYGGSNGVTTIFVN